MIRLRYPKKVRKLWIDALCLKQEDLVEKGQQVRLMPRIYSTARRVLAWLGEATENTDSFLRNANRYGRLNMSDSPPQDRSLEFTKSNDTIIRRPYWKRT